MDNNEEISSNFMAISEMTKEISAIVQKSIDKGNDDLTPSDIEHILKITSDVTMKIKSQIKEITV